MNTQKGITLIALIITIIMMLILVGVSVSAAINTGLFRTTSGVAQNTRNSIKNEQAISAGTINIGGVKYAALEDYINQIPSNENYKIVSEEIIGKDGEFTYAKLSNGKIQISKYIGEKTEITIPAQYDGYEVYVVGNINAKTEIKGQRYNIFGKTDSETNTTMKSIAFEEGIKKIGVAAFMGCSGLTCELKLPSTLVEIETAAFNKCENLKGNLNVPKGVIKIGTAAFQYCVNLKETLILPNTLKEIGEYAFNYCNGFSGDLVIPDSVIKIGARAFSSCTGFDGNLQLSRELSEIGASAFAGCENLTGNLKIPDSVKTIGQYAFENCIGFNGTLTLPSEITEIHEYTFYYCKGLSGELKIPDSVTKIGTSAFGWCTGFTGDLYLPSQLIEIGELAFNRVTLKGDLTIPEGTKKIGRYAFQLCSEFKGVLTLPSSLEIIGDGAFNHCYGLANTSVTIPKNVSIIGINETDASHTFYEFANGKLKEFLVEDGNQHFKAIDGVLYNKAVTRMVGYPAKRGESEYEIPEGVTILDELVFTHAQQLKKIILPNSYILTTTLPENYLNKGNNLAVAIYSNSGIEEVEIKTDNPNYKSIDGIIYSKDGKVLWYVPEAKEGEVTIQDGVTTIKGGAFFGYGDYRARQQTVTIPASVTEIEPTALSELKDLGSSKVTFADGCIYEFKENGTISKKN